MQKRNQGFSLIEVIVFASVVSYLFVVILGYVTQLLRTMKVNEHRVLGTYYVEELMEWLRGERDADWSAFVAKASTSPGSTYCVNQELTGTNTISNLGGAAFPLGNCGTFNGVGSSPSKPIIYKREVTLTKPSNSDFQVNVRVVVSWQENGVDFSVPLEGSFASWE